ncbi:MAG: response regulator [Tangfeifania sp.]
MEKQNFLPNEVEKKLKEKNESFSSANITELEELFQDVWARNQELEKQNQLLETTQTELLALKDRYTDLFKNAPVGYFILDSSFRIQEVNNTACDYFCMNCEDLTGSFFTDFVDDEYRTLFSNSLKELDSGSLVSKCDLKLATVNSGFYGRVIISATDKDGNPGNFRVAVIGDSEINSGAPRPVIEKKQLPKVNDPNDLINYLTILIAEDDEPARVYLSELLKNECKKIHFANNGQEAVEMYAEFKPDLVLMDIKMPVMDGYSAAIKIKGIDDNAFIIAQTAYALAGDREKALAAGCSDYLAKPVRRDDLLNMLRKHLM